MNNTGKLMKQLKRKCPFCGDILSVALQLYNSSPGNAAAGVKAAQGPAGQTLVRPNSERDLFKNHT